MTKVKWIFFVVLIPLGFMSLQASAEEKKNQVEELFIWKMSDELKLTVDQEKKFAEGIRGLNKRKIELNQSLQQSVDRMSKATSLKKKEEELSKYKNVLQEFNKLTLDEVNLVNKQLGVEKTIQYIQFKQELATKIKATLINSDSSPKSEKKLLPQPKVIEE